MEEVKYAKAFTLEELGPNVVNCTFLIRGSVMKRVAELRGMLERGEPLPFKQFYKLHLGNPPVLGQPPITFVRQVIAATFCPSLIDKGVFSEDVAARARYYISNIPNGAIAAYGDAEGFRVFRNTVEKYIAKRDGYPANADNIYMLDGTLDGMTFFSNILFSIPNAGILLPAPEYPGYSLLATQLRGRCEFYHMNPESNWDIKEEELEAAYARGKASGMAVKAILIINPNNPVGSVLTKEQLYRVVRFAHKHRLAILADEVYQQSIFIDKEFISAKKAVCSIEAPYNEVEVASFHSIAKGYIGECGLRGGYMELHNFDPSILHQIGKYRDAYMPNIAGSIATEVMCNPPTYETCSKETADLFEKERNEISSRMATKARIAYQILNQCKGIKCNEIEGAMFAFPRVLLNESAIAAAKAANEEPCEFFCKKMVERTGIITAPGFGFGQKPGTYYYRMSLLVWDVDEFKEMMEKMKKFIDEFFLEYP